MWPFKKKLVTFFRTKKLVVTETPINVGRTAVLLTSTENDTFTTYVYGNAYQIFSEGYDHHERAREPFVENLYKENSLAFAQVFIRNVYIGNCIVDDANNPTTCFYGTVRLASILNTEDYFITIKTAVVENV